LKRGVFTLEVVLDMFVYGLWIAALCLGSFALVMFGFGDGNLGNNCNESYNNTCDTVFRARITWEWAIVFIATFLFFLGIESWKWAKRVYFRKQEAKNGGGRRGSIDLESRVFERYLSTAISTDGEEAEKKSAH
ncbi:Sodium transport ATPase 5, partial [Pyrenophora tritici-repentis]